MKTKKTTENVTVEIKHRRSSSRKIAKHEAGHTLLALALGFPFEYVTIVSDSESRTTRGRLESLPHIVEATMENLLSGTLLSMGGLAGERVNRSKPGSITYGDAYVSGASGDWRMEYDILQRYVPEDMIEPLIKRCFVRAWRLVKLYADVHTKLVEALLSKGTVSYEECSRIWEDRSDKGWSALDEVDAMLGELDSA